MSLVEMFQTFFKERYEEPSKLFNVLNRTTDEIVLWNVTYEEFMEWMQNRDDESIYSLQQVL